METQDFINLPASSNSRHGSENDDPCESGVEVIKSESLPLKSDVLDEINGETPGTMSNGLPDKMDTSLITPFEEDVNDTTPVPPVLETIESVAVVEEFMPAISVHAEENGSFSVQNDFSFSDIKKDETLLTKRKSDVISLSGVKRQRISIDEQQPSVHIMYKSLPRESKQKLEELLQQWSQWHAKSCSSSDDSSPVLESGEETYFPALCVGLDKPSAVTFWMDNQTKIQPSKEFIPLDGTFVPLYDRGYSLALTSADGASSLDGGMEKLDTSRCFNCSSYSHALKDCPKPRDKVAVNNARKEHQSKRSQHANSRNSVRYYQSSRVGKYDGLTPGVLDAETQKLLGLGELDPPPWLNRMREIGYPPGYLDPDMEDQPSGITIFGDETIMDEGEEGEILGATLTEPSKKMTVEYPGINAPIPENADEKLWAPSASSNSNPSRNRSHRRYNHSSENLSRAHYSEQPSENHGRWRRDDQPSENHGRWRHDDQPSENHGRWRHDDLLYENLGRWRYGEQHENLSRGYYGDSRLSRDFEDDGPPGCEPGTSPSLSNHFRRYGDYDSSYYSRSPRDSASVPWSPTYGRSFSDRGRRSPLVHDGSPNRGHYSTYPYSSPR